MQGVSFLLRFLSFLMDDFLFQYPLVEKNYLSSTEWCLCFLSRIKWLYLYKSISGVSVLFHSSLCLYIFPLGLFQLKNNHNHHNKNPGILSCVMSNRGQLGERQSTVCSGAIDSSLLTISCHL